MRLNILADIFRERLFYCVDTLFSALFIGGRARSNKVLVVRLDAIGDFVLWTDAATGLRELYPRGEFELVLLGNSAWIPLAQDLGIFDQVWSLDRRTFSKNLRYRLRLLARVRGERFGIAIQPTFSRDYMFGDTIIRASAAEERIGSESNCDNLHPDQKRVSDRWYTRLIPAPAKTGMELENNAAFLRRLGLASFRAGMPNLPVIAPLPLSLQRYYVLFPGAGSRLRQWPVRNFAALAERVYEATGMTAVICGGSGETGLAEELQQATTAPVQSWVGKSSLRELVSIIAQARFVVGNDTSAIHISAAVSTRSVCILGGGHPGRFLPYRCEREESRPLPIVCTHQMDCYGCNWQCPLAAASESAAPCISQVTVDDVWKAVRAVVDADDSSETASRWTQNS